MADRPDPPGVPPIAVVGMSALFPGAGDLDTYWRNITGGVDAIRDVSPGRFDVDEYFAAGAGVDGAGDSFYCRRGGFVDELAAFDPTAFGIVPNAVDWVEPDQLLALRLAAEAITDAGGAERLGDAERVGVVLGRGGYVGSGVARLEQRVRTSRQLATTLREVLPDLPAEAVERVRAAFVDQLGPVRAEASIGLVPNLAASRIANRLDLSGPAYTVDAACASSLIAVEQAMRDLGSGRTDAMIVGGAHLVHEASFWSVFTLLRALSPTEAIRPLDRRADGILIGEGVGMLVLRRLADARRDGDRIYAVLRGAGTASDGRSASLMAPAVDGQTLAVRRAWADAGLDPTAPGAIGLVEAHGTATPAGDAAELTTLGRIFGTATPGSRPAPDIGIGSVKSMIGHAMPAAGAAGLIKTALALHHQVLPPTLHCDEPHPAFAGSRFAPIRVATPWDTPAGGGPRRAGVNAFGFGGINAHLVVEEAPPKAAITAARTFPAPVPPTAVLAAGSARVGPGRPAAAVVTPRVADPDAEAVLMLAGSGPADLLAQLDRPDAELLDRDDAASPPTGGPWRLAVVAPSPRRLGLARTVVGRGAAWRGRNDLWFTPSGLLDPSGPAAGRTAFLFCGLEDKFAPRIDDVSAHFGLGGLAAADTAVLGQHGVASVQVGRVLDVALRRLGILPDVVGGHSVGEWNAMISSGLVPDAFADSFIAGFDSGSLEVPGVVFGALGCGADRATEVIADLDEIVISHDNCPHQSIVCGREERVRTALDRLRRAGVLGQILPFHSGFHSPFLAPYLGPLRAGLDATKLVEAAVPIWSATTVAPYPREHDAIRELAVRHLLEPVRFRELVARLHDTGVRAFVQVGMGSVAGFVDDTLRGRDYASLVSNSAKRPGLDQLRRVAAAMWVEGASPRLDLLPCRTRPESATAPAGASAEPAPVDAGSGRLAQLPRRHGVPVRLPLGTPLVRLGAAAADLLAPWAGGPAAVVPSPAPTTVTSASPPPVPAPLPAAPPLPVSPPLPAVPSVSPSLPSVPALPGRGSSVRAGSRSTADSPPRQAVLAELRAALADTDSVLAAVVDHWAAGPSVPAGAPARSWAGPGARGRWGGPTGAPAGAGAGSGRPPRPPVATAPPAAPAPASAAPAPASVAPAPVSAARTVRRRVSLESMPHIIDHCFYRQPPGWPDLTDRFPVVPMTEMLEMMIAEAAAVVPPGRVPVGLRDVRALRWLVIEPAVDLSITVTPAGPDAVRVVINGYARGTVLFADAYPAPPGDDAMPTALPGEGPSRHQGRDLYAARFLFHGPGYQGVEDVEGIGAAGIRGRLRVPAASGALLDNAGQLFGYWAMEQLPGDSLLLPAAIAELSLHGPPPVEGDLVDCVVRIRGIADQTVTADLELRRADGRLWAVVTAWTDRRFANDEVLWAMVRAPEVHTVAQPSGEGWHVAHDRWSDAASRELIVRHYLDAAARDQVAQLNPRAARGRLLGRIAAQDAVRRWLWDHGAGPVWGVEVGIDHDEAGAPLVRGLPARPGMPVLEPPWVSLAHKPELAVAVVSADGPVGIDVEKVVPRTPGVEQTALAPAERALLDRLAGDDPSLRALWFTRLWAAKEAAAKADRTGLAGRPRQFVVDGPHPPAPGWSAAAWAGGTPPDLVRVTTFGDGPDGPVPLHSRWVGLRTVDATGQIRPDGLPAGFVPSRPVPAQRAVAGSGNGGGPVIEAGPPRSGAAPAVEAAQPVPEGGPSGRSGIVASYVVAWTSPEVEAAGPPSERK